MLMKNKHQIAIAFDRSPFAFRLVMTLFFGWIFGCVYRVATHHPYAACLWLLCGFFFVGWIADIISLFKYGKYTLWAKDDII